MESHLPLILGIAILVLGVLLFLVYIPMANRHGKRVEVLGAENDDLKKKLDASRDEYKAVKEEFSQAKPELAELRAKYKAAKKESFEADDKVQAAREAAQDAEREEQKAHAESSRLRDEIVALRAEVEKAQKVAETHKGEASRLHERIRELEERPRARPVEAAPRVADQGPSPAQVQGLHDRIAKLERKLKETRDISLDKARQTERTRKRLNAVERAYDVLRGQYNALHDRLLHQMGQEGEADDRDTVLKDDDRRSEPQHKADAPAAAPAVPPTPGPTENQPQGTT